MDIPVRLISPRFFSPSCKQASDRQTRILNILTSFAPSLFKKAPFIPPFYSQFFNLPRMKERPDLTRGGLNFPLFPLSRKLIRHNLTGKYVPKGKKKNWFPAKKRPNSSFGYFKPLSFPRVIMGSGCEKRGQKLGVSWVARHKSKTPSIRPLLRQHDAPPSLPPPA